ncbi:MAG: GNAT family N-acetyltransferase [Hyphomicrobiaceae bacterium]
MDDMGVALKGSWGASCWCMHPRLGDAETRELPGNGPLKDRRRAAMTKLACRRLAPGLLAYEDKQPVGWVAIGPRPEFERVDRSRATPRVDDVDVWIVPCVTVTKKARGQGIAVALIRAAVDYASRNGASAIEAYPRAGDERTRDETIYSGTEPLFRHAGFKVIRSPLQDIPKNWLARVTMRIEVS